MAAAGHSHQDVSNRYLKTTGEPSDENKWRGVTQSRRNKQTKARKIGGTGRTELDSQPPDQKKGKDTLHTYLGYPPSVKKSKWARSPLA